MTDLYLRRFNTPAASAATGGQLEASELDANFTKVHPVLRAILDGAAASFNNNCRTKPVMANPPAITVGTSSVPSGFTREFLFTAAGAPYTYNGGDPSTTGGMTSFPCVTISTATTLDFWWRVSTILEGDAIALYLDSTAADGYRFLVDDQYVTLAGTASGGSGMRYFVLTFPTKKRRRITVEGRRYLPFGHARVKLEDHLFKPDEDAQCPRVWIIGDSNLDILGYELRGDSFGAVLGDHLGLRNLTLNPRSGSGLTENSEYSYQARQADWISSTFDMLIFQMSWNDYNYGSGATPAQMKTAAAALIASARAVSKVAPILFTGIMTWDVSANETWKAGLAAHEAAVAEAIAEADPLCGFVPVRTLADPETFMPGTSQGTPTGLAGRLVNTASDHMTPDGNWYNGRWLAGKVLAKVAQMAGVDVPAVMPPQTGAEITVSATAPASPYEGQLWLDIS